MIKNFSNSVYKKFQPMTPAAASHVRELLTRGGIIVKDSKDYIEIKRQESIAKIDNLGRVEWRDSNN